MGGYIQLNRVIYLNSEIGFFRGRGNIVKTVEKIIYGIGALIVIIICEYFIGWPEDHFEE